jgi:hypothetical protein
VDENANTDLAAFNISLSDIPKYSQEECDYSIE